MERELELESLQPEEYDRARDDSLTELAWSRPLGDCNRQHYARPVPEILIPVTEHTVDGETWLHTDMTEGTYDEFESAPVKLLFNSKVYLKSAWDSDKRIIAYGPPHRVPRKYARVTK